jgi:hypothetical protein
VQRHPLAIGLAVVEHETPDPGAGRARGPRPRPPAGPRADRRARSCASPSDTALPARPANRSGRAREFCELLGEISAQRPHVLTG